MSVNHRAPHKQHPPHTGRCSRHIQASEPNSRLVRPELLFLVVRYKATHNIRLYVSQTRLMLALSQQPARRISHYSQLIAHRKGRESFSITHKNPPSGGFLCVFAMCASENFCWCRGGGHRIAACKPWFATNLAFRFLDLPSNLPSDIFVRRYPPYPSPGTRQKADMPRFLSWAPNE